MKHMKHILKATPENLKLRLLAMGPLWTSDLQKYTQEVKDLYDPILSVSPKENITVHRNIPYASDPQNILDIFQPKGANLAPVVVFVHGGAFVRGSKNTTDELYDNVLYWFANQGYVGINMEYRLAPQASYPQGGIDVAQVIDWTHQHIGEYGGDPEQIFLIGHSAGGTHAASCVFDPAVAYWGRNIKALVLISARLKADALPSNPNAQGVKAYFGEDQASYAIKSPLTHCALSEVPTLSVIAEFENPMLDTYAQEFVDNLSKARNTPMELLKKKNHNHMSIVAHFNTEENELGMEILDFLQSTRLTHTRQ